MSRLLTAIFITSGLMLGSTGALAAGLGSMRVQSNLGAAFRGDIEINQLTPEEEASLTVRIPSAEVYRQAGLEFSPAIAQLRAAVSKEGKASVVLSSANPVSEPIMEVLIELSWSTGRLIRQYTVLLDPAEQRLPPLQASAASAIEPAVQMPPLNAQPLNAQAPSTQAMTMQAAPAATAPPMQTPVQPAAVKQNPSATSVVSSGVAANGATITPARGEGLISLTRRLTKGTSLDLYETVSAIYFANPSAFDRGDINSLKYNAKLNLGAINAPAANIQAINADRQFKEVAKPKNNLAKSNANTNAVAGQVKAAPTSKPIASNKDQVKVAGSAQVGAGQSKAADAADTAAKKRALAEDESRKQQLTKNIDDLKKGLELKTNVVKTPTAPAAPAPAAVASAKPATPAVEIVKPVASAPSAASAPNTPAVPAPAAPMALVPPTVIAPASPATEAVVTKPLATAPTATTTTTPPPAKPAITPVVEEASWYDPLVKDPMVLGGLGGIVALGGLYSLYSRRKKRQSENGFTDSQIEGATGAGNMLTVEGGQAIDTSNSMFASSFSPVGKPLESAEIDPIAEAEVYMQYGRDSHAAEILIDALKANPSNHPVRLKLMELYASKNQTAKLKEQLEEIKKRAPESSKEVQRAVEIVSQADSAGSTSSQKSTALAQNSDSFEIQSVAPTLGANTVSRPIAAPAASISPLAFEGFNSASGPLSMPLSGPPTLISDVKKSNALRPTMPDLNPVSQLTGIQFDITAPATSFGAVAKQGNAVNAPDIDSILEFKLSESSEFDTSNKLNPVTAFPTVSTMTANAQSLETKLSLAKAYLDIGDKEGAKELIQEVIASGHQTLADQAKQMLSKV